MSIRNAGELMKVARQEGYDEGYGTGIADVAEWMRHARHATGVALLIERGRAKGFAAFVKAMDSERKRRSRRTAKKGGKR